MQITLTVQVSIPVTMEFDEQPPLGKLRHAAIENFLDHPALDSPADVELYIDSIGNGEMDLTAPCAACDGKGWIVADNSDHGLRIERCDTCKRFSSDELAERACGGQR